MFKVGQTVWCLIFGQGVVVGVDDEDSLGSYCIDVKFKDDLSISYTSDGKVYAEGNITLFPHPVEVIKSVTKPSIDWSHVSPEYNYLAQDSGGEVFLYEKEPFLSLDFWSIQGGKISAVYMFATCIPGTCDWKDSLVKRPEGETP